MDDLPEGWTATSVGEVSAGIQYGYTASAVQQTEGPRFLRITDIQDGAVDWNAVPSCEIDDERIARFALSKGDIVFARTGATTGKSYLIGQCPSAVFASYLIRLRPRGEVPPEFLAFFFQTPEYWRLISENVAGNAQPNCNASKLAALPVPLPPFAEQQRIVAKVEALLARVNAARQRLASVPGILKRFRQSVLAAACSGRLTADWREEQTDLEAATILLERIRAERTALRSKKGSKTGQEEASPDELFELPEAWAWATLSEIGQHGRPIIYGIIKPGPRVSDGVPYVRVMEMKGGYIDVVNLPRTCKERAEKFKRATLKAGDVLISKDGMVGRVAVVPPELEGGNITQHLVRAAVHAFMNRDYVVQAIRAPAAQNWLNAEKLGVVLQGVNVEDFRRLPIPIPALPEQDEIVRRVETLFRLADTIEKWVAAATTRAEKLTQATLAKAFRGELVPPEAELVRRESRDYEPASLLLERIKGEHAQRPLRRLKQG